MLTKIEKIIILTAGGLMALTFMAGGLGGGGSYMDYLRPFIERWESFSASPYWDVSRYSWGYGTAAPGPTGTITRSQAWEDALTHIQADYSYLLRLISAALSPQQWAALLSFSYNLGPGNADNLVPNINAGNTTALGVQWNEYINAGGVPDNDLIARRAAEWQLWNS